MQRWEELVYAKADGRIKVKIGKFKKFVEGLLARHDPCWLIYYIRMSVKAWHPLFSRKRNFCSYLDIHKKTG